jgi:hypothetical protein
MKPVLLALIVLTHGLQAHHGWAAFETKVETTLQGTVVDFHFVNPHSVVEFDVKDEQGIVHKWQGELSAPNRLTANGWTATTLEQGDIIVVTGNRAKSGAYAIWVTKITSPSGKTLKIGNDY